MFLSKKPKRMCVLHNEWLVKYVWLKQLAGNNSRAFCKVCNKLFTMYHEGENDIKKHASEKWTIICLESVVIYMYNKKPRQ
jgi:RNase P subunit RPR2